MGDFDNDASMCDNDDNGDDSDGAIDNFEDSPNCEADVTGEHWDLGGESGYDTDPVDRFLKVSRWQRQLRTLQHNLKPTALVKRGANSAKKLMEGQKKVVSTLKQRQQKLRRTTEEKMQAFNSRIEKELARLRVKKVRQTRHIVCFTCSMVNMVVMMFWLGRWPQTFHWWYTANCVWLIGCRAVWYRWLNFHYFLLDLCYFANGILLAYMWFFADTEWGEWFLQGISGFSGVLMISIPLFRNSFVPHSLDRVTSFHIHMSPVVQIWVIRWPDASQAATWAWRIPAQMSVGPAFVLYFSWALFYYAYLFVIQSKTIERKGYETLYKHMAENMGIEKSLPKRLQGPVMTKVVFIVGHFILFLSGVFMMHLPFWADTICMCVAAAWGFRNGARFYMTYFWRVYEDQITAFERERAKAEQQLQEHQRCREEVAKGEANGSISNQHDADDDMDD